MSATMFTWRRMAWRAPGASPRRIASRIWWWARSDRGGRPGSPSELCRVSLIGPASPAMKSATRGLRAARVMPPGYPIGGVMTYGTLTSPYMHTQDGLQRNRAALAGRGAAVKLEVLTCSISARRRLHAPI